MKVINNLEEYITERVNMFGDCERVLDTLKKERVFSILYVKEEKRFSIYEKCDGYFGMDLNAEMCKDLAELFSKIATKMEEDDSK